MEISLLNSSRYAWTLALIEPKTDFYLIGLGLQPWLSP